jgi:branched-subunit amino acid aminotransferase/4-amino-4-deoxychorismate lyase
MTNLAPAWLDGRPATAGELAALALTNIGHFTSMRVDDGRVRGLALHLDRLVRDCRTVLGADLDPGQVLALVRPAVSGRRSGAFVVRVTVFDPALDAGRLGGAAVPHVLVTTRPAPPALPPAPPLRLRSCVYRRELPAVKHVGLFGALHQRGAAIRAGFDDALFTDHAGRISEGPTWNIGFFDGAELRWPSADMLPGVTMALLRRARDHTVAPVAVADLDGGWAAFVTSTSVGVRPVAAVDGTPLAVEHPVLAALRAAYLAVPTDSLA